MTDEPSRTSSRAEYEIEPSSPTWGNQECIYLCCLILDAQGKLAFERNISGVYNLTSLNDFVIQLNNGAPNGRQSGLDTYDKKLRFAITKNCYVVIDISRTGHICEPNKRAIVMSKETKGVYADLFHTDLTGSWPKANAGNASNVAFFSAKVEDEVIRFHRFDIRTPQGRPFRSLDPEVRNDGHPPDRRRYDPWKHKDGGKAGK